MSSEKYPNPLDRVSSKQLVRHVARKAIKEQGNGRVISLSDGHVISPCLSAPHDVRRVRGDYWVFDNGKCTINIYDPSWVLKEESSVVGWGRGGSISEHLGSLYAGISDTRKRYLNQVSSQTSSMVQILSTETRTLVGSIAHSGIEQVINVYVGTRKVALTLLRLDEPPVSGRT